MKPNDSRVGEMIISIALCGLYLALLPRTLAAGSLIQACGFVVAWMISPQLKKKLWMLTLMSPILAAALGLGSGR